MQDVGSVLCRVRRVNGGMNDYDVASEMISVQSLVHACDCVIAEHSDGLTIRGCPVPDGNGSPLAVAMKTSTNVLFVAGSALEMDLPNSERYKSGKSKVSVLIIGFYCSKKKYYEEGAVFHVSSLQRFKIEATYFLN